MPGAGHLKHASQWGNRANFWQWFDRLSSYCCVRESQIPGPHVLGHSTRCCCSPSLSFDDIRHHGHAESLPRQHWHFCQVDPALPTQKQTRTVISSKVRMEPSKEQWAVCLVSNGGVEDCCVERKGGEQAKERLLLYLELAGMVTRSVLRFRVGGVRGKVM